MTHWTDAGFGTDPEGDARRRAEQGVIELPDGTRVAGAPDAPTAVAALAAHGLPAIPLGAALPDGRTVDDLRVEVRPCCNYREELDRPCRGVQRFRPGDLQAACDECGGWCGIDAPCRVAEPDPHAITRTEYGSSVALVCACGRWECIVTGPSSAAWAGADYRRHVQRETASDA